MSSKILLPAIAVTLALTIAWLPEACRAQQWVDLTPDDGPAPAPRSHAAAIYDADGHRLVLFGGRTAAGSVNDVWALDLNTQQWTELTPSEGPAPAPRFTPGGLYDAGAHRMIIWSGQGADGFFNDVWAFDLASHTWSAFDVPDPQPNPRYGVATIFDPLARDLVTVAGFTDQGRFGDTWRFDLQDASWTEVSPADGPGLRCLHTASYDAREHRMVLYGGQRSGPLDDLWAFDLNADTWTELTPPDRPAGRFFAASVYDELNHRLLVFGGNRGSGDRTNEVWSFDLTANQWDALTLSGPAPSAREGAVAVYIESEDRMIIVGGNDGQHRNDVWALEDLSLATGTEPDEAPHEPASLEQNYPNPFNPSTTIAYTLPARSHVVLRVYDVLGHAVRTLVNGSQAAGRQTITWDGTDASGRPVASGVYVYTLQTLSLSASRVMTLVK